MKTGTFFLLILLMFLISSIFYYIAIHSSSEQESPNKEYKPSIIGKMIKGNVYGETGIKEYVYTAKQSEFYKIADVTRFSEPYVLAFNVDGSTQKWEIQSQEGMYNTNDSLSLYNDVKIATFKMDEISKNEEKNVEIFTSYLELDLDTKDVRTDRQVDMFDKALSENHGKFLEGNIDTNQYHLSEDCHAIIQPADFENVDKK